MSFVVLGNWDLLTQFVSDTQLQATVPARLLAIPRVWELSVVNGDVMGWTDGYQAYPKSAAIPFTVTAP
jgi:hypothetical protein